MSYHMLIFAVNRHKVLGFSESVHELDFFLTCVSGYMNFKHCIAPYRDAVTDKLINYSVDPLFLPGIALAEITTRSFSPSAILS